MLLVTWQPQLVSGVYVPYFDPETTVDEWMVALGYISNPTNNKFIQIKTFEFYLFCIITQMWSSNEL